MHRSSAILSNTLQTQTSAETAVETAVELGYQAYHQWGENVKEGQLKEADKSEDKASDHTQNDDATGSDQNSAPSKNNAVNVTRAGSDPSSSDKFIAAGSETPASLPGGSDKRNGFTESYSVDPDGALVVTAKRVTYSSDELNNKPVKEFKGIDFSAGMSAAEFLRMLFPPPVNTIMSVKDTVDYTRQGEYRKALITGSITGAGVLPAGKALEVIYGLRGIQSAAKTGKLISRTEGVASDTAKAAEEAGGIVKNRLQVPDDWRPIGGVGAQVNTPRGFTSYQTPDGEIVHVSPRGLRYGFDPKFGNRVDHVLAHTAPNSNKPVHSVFNVQGDDALALVDRAWARRGLPDPNDSAAFVVDMGYQIGTVGETSIRIVVRPGTTDIITAYPY